MGKRVSEEKEIGKNGLKKKLVKEGEGWETLDTSDEVEVDQMGTLLDGTQFDSSHDQGTSFKFKLVEVFTIRPELAYGEFNPPSTIPLNVTLQFDVELLSWHNVKDIYQYGGILKNILVKGDGWENPKDLNEVLVYYEARRENGTLISKFDGSNLLLKRVEITRDKKVLKKTQNEGEGYGQLNDGAVVKLADEKNFTKKGDDERLFEFKIDEEYGIKPVIKGLDLL
ncbi:70 kDa peptidyl-prolyl isomerase-like [Cucumis melo var. makuwa]|uniref:peptidylprolyl isomerase n=1 Tax=Cucumis melo var. makuwa TaxID=1194695 RepID=A0A5D3B949_CUCMM|nr:70 kDa peptidyl-prolyl isomerase-like [Cucumis melo var. makuwa]TYJ95539.1 70 kDa peptidyl-prolyl isomerase-like [Cucumis melo var. makuwa]